MTPHPSAAAKQIVESWRIARKAAPRLDLRQKSNRGELMISPRFEKIGKPLVKPLPDLIRKNFSTIPRFKSG
jgi:hypothetical protein